MSATLAPCHAHIYYTDGERPRAERLRDDFLDKAAQGEADILFVGQMTDRAVGPHPIPQYEVHFLERSRSDIIAAIEASGLRALVHPLTDDDLADHTKHAHWVGEPIDLDVSVLDPPGENKGIPRFGKSDF
ncbi:MAG TPA: DOPA 4,5-dioxygenase family protein [Sphingomicrobium sp.]